VCPPHEVQDSAEKSLPFVWLDCGRHQPHVLWRAQFSRPPPAASSGLTNRYVSDAAIDRNGAW